MECCLECANLIDIKGDYCFCSLEPFAQIDFQGLFTCDSFCDRGNMINVKYKLLKNGSMPQKKTSGAACADCYAALKQDMVLATFESSQELYDTNKN